MSSRTYALSFCAYLCCIGIAFAQSSSNLARTKTAIISTQVAPYLATNTTDGDSNTRWSSNYTDPQFIYIDLGASYFVTNVKLSWEIASAKAYTIDVSGNSFDWVTVFTVTNNSTLINDISFAPVPARYVRMTGTQRNTAYGYSLYEFEVYSNVTTPSSSTGFQYEAPQCFGSTDLEERREYTAFPPRLFVAWYCDRPGGIQGYARVYSFNSVTNFFKINIPYGTSKDQKAMVDRFATNRPVTSDEDIALQKFLAKVRPVAVVDLNSGSSTRPIYTANSDRTLGPKTTKVIPIGSPCLINDRLISWTDIAKTIPKATNYYAVPGGYAICKLSGSITVAQPN